MMEKKLVIVPFDLELSKRITNGEAEGRIITRVGNSVRILCFDVIGNKYKICALLHGGKSEEPEIFTEKGLLYDNKTDDLDLMLEIPEYMTFKDGDILYAKTNEFHYIFIYRDKNNDKTNFYAAIDDRDTLWIEDNRITSNDDVSELRFATEPEKQKLIEALKASEEPKAKECLKMLGIEVKPECEFKPKDWVLCYSDGWNLCQFSHTKLRDIDNKLMYVTVGGIAYEQCIPYNEETAHLLGTNKD